MHRTGNFEIQADNTKFCQQTRVEPGGNSFLHAQQIGPMTNWNRRPILYPMVEGPHIILTLDTKEPIELGAFVGAFTSLANEYDRYIRATEPDLAGEADMFVNEIRSGSTIIDLVPYLAYAAPFIDSMEKILIVEKFVKAFKDRFEALLHHKKTAPQTRSELKDWSDAVKAVATDSKGTAKIEAAYFKAGKKKIRAAFKFSTPDAIKVLRTVESRQKELEKTEHADHLRVLMRFTRSDIGTVHVGKPSGERVKIEEISDRPLALVYGSALAEERIKHEIREADENVYKKGFVVDVNVRSTGGRPVAYAITNVHQVIELPE
jgi:hypothetical protein